MISIKQFVQVVVHTSQLFMGFGLIIYMYNLTLVYFEKSFDLKNFNNARNALSAFAFIASNSQNQSFFVFSKTPKY